MKFTLVTLLSVLALDALTAAEAQKYIVQLDHTATIDEFLPMLVKGFSKEAAGSDAFNVGSKWDIGGTFKAFSLELENDKFLDSIRSRFSEVINIVPDEEFQLDLPKPVSVGTKKRNFVRPTRRSSYANRDRVSYISSDGAVKRAVDAEATYEEQEGAEWNLVRVSEHDLDLEQPYIYDSTAGEGVIAYIVDDGLYIDHNDFEGRATHGWSAYSDGNGTATIAAEDPLNGGGHGTHVAGIIGGKTYGLAKKASLVRVQVLSPEGSGSISNVISGIQWIQEQEKGKKRPVVVNMSLAMPASNATKVLDEAIEAAVAAGIPMFVAAGNDASDACEQSPAGNDKVLSVGSVGKTDAFAYTSCYGKCVGILAPGSSITSCYIGGKDATAELSGTSMASPHVAGVAALLLPTLEEGVAPADLYAELTKIATADKITDIPDGLTPNKLLFNGQAKTEN